MGVAYYNRRSRPTEAGTVSAGCSPQARLYLSCLELCLTEAVIMAEYLATIFSTEKDKVNCSFYFKIGACRHGEGCSRLHNKPTFSQTILMQNLYQNPATRTQNPDGTLQTFSLMSEEEQQEYYDTFFEDVFIELEEKYGDIEELNVCDNLGDHLIGNVYVKFKREEDAEKAVLSLNNRWFNGKPIR